MALGHSAINPLLYIVFSTRAVRASFLQLRKRVLPQCCLGRRGRGGGHGGRGQGQASHRSWVVTPEPSTASGDGGDRKAGPCGSRCMVCRRKRLGGTARGTAPPRVVVFSSQPAHQHQHQHHHHHHYHHQCYPPHHQTPQHAQSSATQRGRAADNGFRATSVHVHRSRILQVSMVTVMITTVTIEHWIDTPRRKKAEWVAWLSCYVECRRCRS